MAEITVKRLQIVNPQGDVFTLDPVAGESYDDATQQKHGLMSTSDKTKLDGIASGANVADIQYDPDYKKITKTINGTSSDVVSAATLKTAMQLNNVNNTSDADKPISDATQSALDDKIDYNLIGIAGGVAELDLSGKVPSSQLPSYVDDVLEYQNSGSFPLTGEVGKIYVAVDTNKTYRWGGSAYVEISESLAIGETSSTAYRGDHGKAAYDHASDSSKLTTSQTSGLYKIATTDEGHIASVTPVTKSDITDLGIPETQPDISGKADKVQSATSGNFASLDVNGNLTDSGKKASDFVTTQDNTKKLDKYYTNVLPMEWNGLTTFNGSTVWTDGDNIYVSHDYSQKSYVLDKTTLTWSPKTWNNFEPTYGNFIWHDGDNIYYSDNNNQYILDKATSTWTEKTWYGLDNVGTFRGDCVWTDGDDIYYSLNYNQLVLDRATSTWSPMTWTGLATLYGSDVWIDGDNIYYSGEEGNYILDKTTSTWTSKTWYGINSTFFGRYIWSVNENIYYNYYDQYVLNRKSSTWISKTWYPTLEHGSEIWTDGDSFYYSHFSTQYKLNTNHKVYTGIDGEYIPVDIDSTPSENSSHLVTSGGVYTAVNSIINLVYPVGAIYMSVSSTSPTTLFGGTWERLKDRFLLGAGDTYSAGSTGGAASQSYTPAGTNSGGAVGNHTLTVDEIPSHNHSFTGTAVTSGGQSQGHTHTFTTGNQSQDHTHDTTTGNQSSGHKHTGPSHTHSGPSHSHTGPSHKHSVGAHSHGLNSHTHGAGSYSAASNGSHTHPYGEQWVFTGKVYPGTADYGGGVVSGGTSIVVQKANNLTTASGGAHTHSVSGTSGAASGSTANSTAFDSGSGGNTATGTAGTGDTGAAGTGKTGGIDTNHTHTGTSGGVSKNHTHSGTSDGVSQGHTHSVTASGTIGSTGGGGAHSHGFTNPTFTGTAATIDTMPPYLAVYMWKRTA